MRYYITIPINESAAENDYRIVKVQEADHANFLQDYGHLVIASGDSLMEALQAFGQRENYEA